MQAWEDIPESEREFQRRGMEIFAGFTEHTDTQVGRLVEGLEQRGLRENTLIFYIWGDNGSSAEGQRGSISELLAQNNIPNTIDQQLAALDKLGGLKVLGSPKTDNMYHAGWAWAGSTPFKATKLVASHFGGTRNPMVVSWPKGIKPDKTMRSQFHHVVDIVPTIYEILEIEPPQMVNGLKQMKIDGDSLAYTLTMPRRRGGNQSNFSITTAVALFIRMVGWRPLSAHSFPGTHPPLYHASLNGIQPQMSGSYITFPKISLKPTTFAKKESERLTKLKEEFLVLAADNRGFPIGAGNWLRLHPEDRIKSPYTQWNSRPILVACQNSPLRELVAKATRWKLISMCRRKLVECFMPLEDQVAAWWSIWTRATLSIITI